MEHLARVALHVLRRMPHTERATSPGEGTDVVIPIADISDVRPSDSEPRRERRKPRALARPASLNAHPPYIVAAHRKRDCYSRRRQPLVERRERFCRRISRADAEHDGHIAELGPSRLVRRVKAQLGRPRDDPRRERLRSSPRVNRFVRQHEGRELVRRKQGNSRTRCLSREALARDELSCRRLNDLRAIGAHDECLDSRFARRGHCTRSDTTGHESDVDSRRTRGTNGRHISRSNRFILSEESPVEVDRKQSMTHPVVVHWRPHSHGRSRHVVLTREVSVPPRTGATEPNEDSITRAYGPGTRGPMFSADSRSVSSIMQIYRDNRHVIDLRRALRKFERCLRASDALDMLLRAAELEAALADANDPASETLEAWTNAAATALVERCEIRAPTQPLPEMSLAHVSASRPEGFAYYGVHPLDYTRAANGLLPKGAPALVIGVRTIGVALSAAVLAALLHQRHDATRITVRPNGHPFDRRLIFTRRAEKAVQDIASRSGGWVLIVDEGPGQSGSSFLAVSDAVILAGMPRERVVLITSHAPNLARLCAPRAEERWSALRWVAARPCHVPSGETFDVSAGAWRTIAYLDENAWPETWPTMERRKLLHPGGRSLLKFEGLGMYGMAPRIRAEMLFERGITVMSSPHDHGFVAWEWLGGRPLPAESNPMPLDVIARSTAARLELPVDNACDEEALESMVRVNVRELLGLDIEIRLPTQRIAIVDGRMQPHEWVRIGSRVVKLDGVAHGDDHFFPGPCDIAWDLAGAIVEWHMCPGQAQAFLERYARMTGDSDVFSRLERWMIAYLAFRAGWLAMAEASVCDDGEKQRLLRGLTKMRGALERASQRHTHQS